jgi:hypothetical protein
MLATMATLIRSFVAVALFSAAIGCTKKDPPPTETTSAAASASASKLAAAIVARPVGGELAGAPFTLKKMSMVTGKGFNEWRISVEGSTLTAEIAAIRLPVRGPLGPGKTFENAATPLTPGASVPGIAIQNGPNNTSTTNASYRIEITKWDVKPCPTDGEATHEGGLASGRIIVSVPQEKVEVSGTFTDAAVSYKQTPDWKYQ